MEIFCEWAPWQTFEWVLNTPLEADAQKSYEKKPFGKFFDLLATSISALKMLQLSMNEVARWHKMIMK